MNAFLDFSYYFDLFATTLESHRGLTTFVLLFIVPGIWVGLLAWFSNPVGGSRQTARLVTRSMNNRFVDNLPRSARVEPSHIEYLWTTVAEEYKCQLLTNPQTLQPAPSTCIHLQYFEKHGSGRTTQWNSVSKAYLIVPAAQQDTWVEQFQFGYMDFGEENTRLLH